MSSAIVQKRHFTIDDIYALPEGNHAELINGQIYNLAAPGTTHQRILSFLHLEIGNHIRKSGGSCEVFPAPFAVFLNTSDQNNWTDYLEPDISVICDPQKIDGKGCHGAPDWIIEIVSPSSRQMDYYKKLALYQSAGVREYWIIDPDKSAIIVYDLEHQAAPALFRFTGEVPSGIYPGFSINFSNLKIIE